MTFTYSTGIIGVAVAQVAVASIQAACSIFDYLFKFGVE